MATFTNDLNLQAMFVTINKNSVLTFKPRTIIIKHNEYTLTFEIADKIKMNKIKCTLSTKNDSITHEKSSTIMTSAKETFTKQFDKSKQGYVIMDNEENTRIIVCKKFEMNFCDWKMNTKWNKVYLTNTKLPEYTFSYAIDCESVNFGKHDLYGYNCYHKKLLVNEKDCAGKYEVFLRHTPDKPCYLSMSHTHNSNRILYQLGENKLDITYNHVQENIRFAYEHAANQLLLKKSAIAIRDNKFFDLHKELTFEKEEPQDYSIECSANSWKRMAHNCDMSKIYTEHSNIIKKVHNLFKQNCGVSLDCKLTQHELNKMNY